MSEATNRPCPDRIDEIERYLEGGEMTPRLEAHIASCPACGRHVKRLTGLEAFLRQAHDGFEDMEPGALMQRRRLVPHKIAAWAVLAVLLGAGVFWVLDPSRRDGKGRAGEGLVAVAVPGVEDGRVILTTGSPSTVRCGPDATSTASLGSRVVRGCEVDVPGDGGLAISIASDLTLLGSGGARFTLVESTSASRVVKVTSGRLGLYSASAGGRAGLVVMAGKSTIEAQGRLMTVSAIDGELDRVTAVEGGLTVRTTAGRVKALAGGQMLDAGTFTVRPASDEGDDALLVIDLLGTSRFRSTLTVLAPHPVRVRVAGHLLGLTPLSVMLGEGDYDVSLSTPDGTVLLVETVHLAYGQEKRVVYEVDHALPVLASPGQDGGPVEGGQKPARAVDIVALIKEALAEGDAVEALALVEKHWVVKKGDPEFLEAAGDTYRKLGRFEDAVSAYLSAAEAATGTSAEKSYLAAARLRFESLRDEAGAEQILSSYWARFPAGFYRGEAQFLGARILVKQKRYVEARSALESLLATSPKGYLATKAHLLLGSILVTYMSDCKAARPHLAAVKQAAPGGKYAAEADHFLEACGAP